MPRLSGLIWSINIRELNPRRKFATGSASLALAVRGCSRRFMIVRFRPAIISLINRRHYLQRLLLTLSSKYNDRNQRFVALDRSHYINFRLARDPTAM